MAEAPVNHMHWLHQTYEHQWKGTVDASTTAGPQHAPKTPQWCCSLTASGAVLRDKSGKNVTLEPISAEAEARSKKEAEQQAARQVYERLVQQGWYNPAAPHASRKPQGVSRAGRFISDNTPSNENNPLAYLDVSIDGQPAGRIVFELFQYKKGSTLQEHAPLAVSNFLALCRGVELAGRRPCYAGVPVTRIMTRFIIQAGDVVNRDGTGSAQIHTAYGDHFPDEGLDDRNYRFAHPFMLACANLGLEDTNGSQFLITTAPAAQLAGEHTCFGKVLAGYGVVKEIEAVADISCKPRCPVLIEAAGELPPGTDLTRVAPAVSAAGWPLWPEDQGPPPEGVREVAFRLDIADQLKTAGNMAYKQGDAAAALAHYDQAARFLSWTSFKHRDAAGDVDITPEEQRALWDAEVLLMGNAAAAHLKLGSFRAAAEACEKLLSRTPTNVKALLRAGQAHMGLGPAEYSSAAAFLQQALEQAKQQQLPTQDVVAQLHRLHNLRQQHTARQRSKFSSAFAAGLLRQPADDPPTPTAATEPGGTTNSAAAAAAAAAAAGLRHVVVSPERRVAGPVPVERVLHGGQPVLMDDAWGTHLLVADDDASSEEEEAAGAAGAGSTSYSRGLMARLQKLGLLGSEYGPCAAGGGGSWDDHTDSEDGDWWADRAEGGEEQHTNGIHSMQGKNGQWSLAPAGPHGLAEGEAGAHRQSSSRQHSDLQVGDGDLGDGSSPHAAGEAEDAAAEQPGVPEESEASEAAAAGVAVSALPARGLGRSYGDGALGSMAHKVPL